MPESYQDTKWSLSVRFGDDLLEEKFTVVPNMILRHYAELGIAPVEMMFCIHVWEYWWDGRDPYPSLTAIAEKMGVSRRQAQRYTESLRQKGFIETEVRIVPGNGPGTGQLTNEYNFAPLLNAIRDHMRRVHGKRFGADPVEKLSTEPPPRRI